MKIMRIVLVVLLTLLMSCSSETDELLDLADLALDQPQRQPIDTARLGVNAFFNIPELGSTVSQFIEVRDTLGLGSVRVLFAWTTPAQPSPGSAIDYGFLDEIIASIPPGVDVLITIAHTPDWMTDSANWINGDAIGTWVERWLRPTVARYAGNPSVVGWQIFNEPDHLLVPSDVSLGLTDPARYVELLTRSAEVVRSLDPGKLVVLAATRSIQQDGGNNLDYNKNMREFGAEELVDIWAIHYYGEQFERVVQRGGVAEFLNGLSKPIWITESGEMGLDNQLQFAETVWPFLRSEIGGIDRIYYYRFGDRDSPETTFALRNTSGVSNLYIRLRDGS